MSEISHFENVVYVIHAAWIPLCCAVFPAPGFTLHRKSINFSCCQKSSLYRFVSVSFQKSLGGEFLGSMCPACCRGLKEAAVDRSLLCRKE